MRSSCRAARKVALSDRWRRSSCPRQSGVPVDPASVRRLASRELPDYMVPGEIIPVAAFPLTPNGKVDRKALLELSAGSSREQGFEAPRTPVEKLLAGIWTELLEIEKISIDDDFFDLGGHSLLVLQLAMRLEEEIALSMDYGDFFRFPTIRMLAVEITERLLLWRRSRRLRLPRRSSRMPDVTPRISSDLEKRASLETELLARRKRAMAGASIPKADPAGPVPLSPAQHRIWFSEKIQERTDFQRRSGGTPFRQARSGQSRTRLRRRRRAA